MRILFAAPESYPYVKLSDVGAFTYGLTKKLRESGAEAAVILPLYNYIDKKSWKLKPIFKGKTVKFYDGEKQSKIKFGLYSSSIPGSSAPAYFIESKKVLGGGGVYFPEDNPGFYKKNVQRFVFFGEAVLACLQNNLLGFSPDILHASGWQGGYLVSLISDVKNQKLKSKNKKLNQANTGTDQLKDLKTTLSVHNVSDQGILRNKNFLKEGVGQADYVTTGSPTYAKEIQTKDFGAGLHRNLSKRNPCGILGGCDYDLVKNFGEKGIIKLKFQEANNLKTGLSKPLLSFVSELSAEKGAHLILAVLPYLVEVFDAELAIMGYGDSAFEDDLLKLMKRYPENVFVRIGYDENLAHEICYASDFALAPHAAEPSGVLQFTAMRCGAVPIARRTGALCDIIEHGKTGILFDGKDEKALLAAIEEALLIFAEEEKIREMQNRCMAADFGWKRAAEEYLKIYKKLVNSG